MSANRGHYIHTYLYISIVSLFCSSVHYSHFGLEVESARVVI